MLSEETRWEKVVETYLEGKFVLLLVGEGPHFCDNVAQVVLDEHYGGAEFSSNSLFALIWHFVCVVAENIAITIEFQIVFGMEMSVRFDKF